MQRTTGLLVFKNGCGQEPWKWCLNFTCEENTTTGTPQRKKRRKKKKLNGTIVLFVERKGSGENHARPPPRHLARAFRKTGKKFRTKEGGTTERQTGSFDNSAAVLRRGKKNTQSTLSRKGIGEYWRHNDLFFESNQKRRGGQSTCLGKGQRQKNKFEESGLGKARPGSQTKRRED